MEKIELLTGTLQLEKNKDLDNLIGFASRANNKRGFLFVSKVLGKHIPSKPCEMEKVHKALADRIKPLLNNRATIVIGFAETATGIGNGVYDQLNIPDSFYIHTTRYKLDQPVLLEFQEEHCHAPSHILYDLKDKDFKNIINQAENIVLVDDEITTGKTLENIVNQLRNTFPHIKNYFAVSVLNWMKHFPDSIKFINLYQGDFNFSEKDFTILKPATSVTANQEALDQVIPYNFGRFGIKDTKINYADYISLNDLKTKKVLVLGTGEFMHQSFLLGKYLEDNSIDAYVQSTTRSPINTDCDIRSKLEFKDNYYENIDNFLYNVIDQSYYDTLLICYETTSTPENHHLKPLLEKYFPEVQEIFLKSVI